MEEETKKTDQELNLDYTIDIDTAARITAAVTRIKPTEELSKCRKMLYDSMCIILNYGIKSCSKEEFNNLTNKYIDELSQYSKEYKSSNKQFIIVPCEPVPKWLKDMFMERYDIKLIDNAD